MSNAERLLLALAPTFGDDDRIVDEALIDEVIEAISQMSTPRITGSMTAEPSFQVEFEDVAGLRDAWVDWLGAFARVRIEIEEVHEIGDNVVTMVSQTGTTRHGVAITQPSAGVWKFRDGLLSRVEFHLDRTAALESAAEPL